MARRTRIGKLLTVLRQSSAQRDTNTPRRQLPAPIPVAEQLRDPALRQLPQRKSNEEQDRRTRSLTHFGHARLLDRRAQLSAAVREYQCAWVWNPNSKQILDELIPLCFRNEQHAVGYRYARICLERGWDTVAPLPGIALSAVLEANSEPSWDVYGVAIKAAQEQQSDDALLRLHYDRLRLAYLDKSYQVALPSAKFLLKALSEPKQFDVDETTKEELWSDAAVNYSLMGEVFFQTDHLELAEQAFQRAADAQAPHGPADELAIVHLRRGRLRERQHRHAAAAQELSKYLTVAGSAASLTAYELLERVTKQKPEQFAANLAQEWEANPRNDGLAHFLADYYLRQQAPGKVAALCEQLAQDERDVSAQSKLLETFVQLQRAGRIVASLGRITKLYGNLDLVEKSVDLINSDERLCKLVLDEVTRRLNDKKRPIVWSECFGAACLSFAKEDFANAKKFVQAGTDLGADDPAMIGTLFSYGEKLIEIDRFDEAASVFQDCISADPENKETDDIRYYLAVAQQLAGDFDAALATIDGALEQSPASFTLLARRPGVLYAAGRLKEARHAYETLIRQFDENEDEDVQADLFAARSMVSAICSEMQDFAAAEEWLIEALGGYPNDAGAKNDLGYLWADQAKHLKLARHMIEAAVAEEPDNSAFLDSLGWVLYRLGNAEEAIGAFATGGGWREHRGSLLTTWGTSTTTRDALLRRSRLGEKPKLHSNRAKKQTK